jgi:acetyl-CoA carboxylase biotin carboxylase subunit
VKKKFKKVLVANRGEIAIRVIRTLREMGIKSVAVYSSADKDGLWLRFADDAICIGDARASDSYLNMERLINAAIITESDAIHPGYGFLSENAEFSKLCAKNDIVFIGPSPDSIKLLGHKATARDLAKKSGVPIVPGSSGCVKKDYLNIAKKIGFPILIKAASGGGGKGMRVVFEEEDLLKEVELAKKEALAAFKDDDIFFEKYIEKPRHVEIQFARDYYGNVITFLRGTVHFKEGIRNLLRKHPRQ